MLTNADGTPFEYPYFISDSYDSTDAINHFDWAKATDSEAYPENTQSQAYTKGLIAIRRSTDAFTLKTKEEVDRNVSLITNPNENGVGQEDLIIAYQTIASNGDIYAVFINADTVARDFVLTDDYRNLLSAEIIADGKQAGVEAIENPSGVTMTETGLTLEPLTATILRLKKASAETERTLYDEASGVSVILGAGERDDIKKIKVSHQETNDVKTPEVLKGTDYDLFDIQPTDNFGNVLAITKTARVILPIDAGKTVAQVFYLPENGQPQSLAFEEISRTVAGQTLKFVIFNTEHFSQYGIIYAQEAAQSSSAMATQTSAENGVTPDDQAQASVVETTTTPTTVDANLETLTATDTADILPATGEKDGTLLSFAGVLSLASIALLELKRRKKSE